MSVRYVLAPQAAIDLVEIWRYIKEQSSLVIADRVETAIREKFSFLAQTPGAGHRRKDLTEADVKFFPVLWLAKILLGFEIKNLWRFLSSRWDVTPERCSISCGSVWAPLPVCFALVAASY